MGQADGAAVVGKRNIIYTRALLISSFRSTSIHTHSVFFSFRTLEKSPSVPNLRTTADYLFGSLFVWPRVAVAAMAYMRSVLFIFILVVLWLLLRLSCDFLPKLSSRIILYKPLPRRRRSVLSACVCDHPEKRQDSLCVTKRILYYIKISYASTNMYTYNIMRGYRGSRV